MGIIIMVLCVLGIAIFVILCSVYIMFIQAACQDRLEFTILSGPLSTPSMVVGVGGYN
jgi:hypothetical protein